MSIKQVFVFVFVFFSSFICYPFFHLFPLFKKCKICNIVFWIEHDSPPALWNFSENSSILKALLVPQFLNIQMFECFFIFHWIQCKGIGILKICSTTYEKNRLNGETSSWWVCTISPLCGKHSYFRLLRKKTSLYFNAFVLWSTLKNQQQQQHSLCLFAAPSSQNGFGRCFFRPNFFFAGGVCKTRTEVDLHWIVRCCFMPCLNKLARQCFPCCYRRYFGKQNVCDSMCTGFQIKMTILQCMSR